MLIDRLVGVLLLHLTISYSSLSTTSWIELVLDSSLDNRSGRNDSLRMMNINRSVNCKVC